MTLLDWTPKNGRKWPVADWQVKNKNKKLFAGKLFITNQERIINFILKNTFMANVIVTRETLGPASAITGILIAVLTYSFSPLKIIQKRWNNKVRNRGSNRIEMEIQNVKSNMNLLFG